MLKLGSQVRVTEEEKDFLMNLTGKNEFSNNVESFDKSLEHSANLAEDGTAEGRLLAGLIRLSKSTPDELDTIPDDY